MIRDYATAFIQEAEVDAIKQKGRQGKKKEKAKKPPAKSAFLKTIEDRVGRLGKHIISLV